MSVAVSPTNCSHDYVYVPTIRPGYSETEDPEKREQQVGRIVSKKPHNVAYDVPQISAGRYLQPRKLDIERRQNRHCTAS